MYLMPHANKDTNGKYWVADTGDKDNPSKATLPGEGTAQDWITWMVAESEKVESEATQYQWLTDYEMPQPEEGEEDGDFAYSFSKAIEVSSPQSRRRSKIHHPRLPARKRRHIGTRQGRKPEIAGVRSDHPHGRGL